MLQRRTGYTKDDAAVAGDHPADVRGSQRGFRRRRAAAVDDGVGEAPAERGVAWRERTALAVGSGFLLIGRIVQLIASLIALLIAAAILFRVLDANAANSIVSTIHDAGKTLVGPFDGMFSFKDPKLAIAVNWGIALLVYLVVGSIIAGFLRGLAVDEEGVRRGRRGRMRRTETVV